MKSFRYIMVQSTLKKKKPFCIENEGFDYRKAQRDMLPEIFELFRFHQILLFTM